MKLNRKSRVTARFLLFNSELVPLTRDVTCSRLYFDGNNMSDEHSPSHKNDFSIEKSILG